MNLYDRPAPTVLDSGLRVDPPRGPTDIRIEPPDLQEVESAIQSLRSGKSPGPDMVTAEMLKYGGSVCAEKIQQLLERIWNTETFPWDYCARLRKWGSIDLFRL